MTDSDYWSLVGLLATLYPWRDEADRKTRPLICLLGQSDSGKITDYLRERITPGLVIEHTLADPGTDDEVARMRAVLEDLTELLETADHQRIRKFPRYRLVASLTAKPPGSYTDGEIRAALDDAWVNATVPEIGIKPLDLLIRILWPLLGKARLSGRVPIFSGIYRWFTQDGDQNMVTIARRLVGNRRFQANNSDYALRLLVGSFMEDIRVAYRSRKRTACCTLLLSNVTEQNGGQALLALLETINAVRRPSAPPDPLLVVAVYNDQNTQTHEIPSISRAPQAYKDLTDDLLWLGPPDGTAPKSEPERIPLPPTKPPLLMAMVIAVVLMVAILLVGNWYHGRQHCGSWLNLAGTNFLEKVNNECVGVAEPSPDAFPIFRPELRKIASRNAAAEAEHRTTGRPLVTLVYLGILTAPDYGKESLATEREGLRGIVAAQSSQLNHTATSPLLKVLVANGGQKMSSGPEVAEEIVSWAHDDPSIIGVVGLGESYRKTLDTISVLSSAGIPSIGATVSADVFADTLPLYFQVVPQNRREAEVVAAYLKQNWTPGHSPHGSPVRIYRSDDPDDIYSSNLASDVADSLSKVGFRTQQIEFTPDRDQPHHDDPSILHLGNATAAGQNACGFSGLVFYAGRPLPDFGDFLKGSEDCPNPVTLRIIADDDTTRYVADKDTRTPYKEIAFDYVSYAIFPSHMERVERDFNDRYYELFGAENKKSSDLDGHAALASDAAETFINAIQQSGQSAPSSPAAVAREISVMGGFLGASGHISFAGSPNHRVPIDKAVLLLQVRPGKELQFGAYCGPPPPLEPRTLPWCPHG